MIGPRANNDAEVFADALDGRGPRNSEVRQLVRLAESLCESAVDPAPGFLLSLRAQLMADATTILVKTTSPARAQGATFHPAQHPVRRRLAAATASLIAMGGMIGIVASSAQAVPGDMLYSVKRGVENVELTLHRSDASRGSFQLAQASERLAEAHSLSTQTDPRSEALVVKSLSEFSDSAASGSESLFKDFNNGGDKGSIDKVSTFAKTSSLVLESMSAKLPASSTDAFTNASVTISDLVSQASTLCAACNIATLPSNLASTVTSLLTHQKSTKTAATTTSKTTKPTSSPTDVVSGIIGGATSAVPNTVVPSTSPPTTAASSSPKLPLIGTLLGDDEQTGLVPGLIHGLLGGG